MDLLKQFYDNKAVHDAVRDYFSQTLNELALIKLFKGEDAKEIAGAKVVIDKAFTDLADSYGPVQEPNIINNAR